jgi:acetyl-CoA acyltransferase 1
VSGDDVVVVSACRTALCKAKRGGFKDTPVDDLIAAVLKDTIRRSGVEPEVCRALLPGQLVLGKKLATAACKLRQWDALRGIRCLCSGRKAGSC